MSKYEPLEQFLKRQTSNEVPLTFAEIERILGFTLPKASGDHRAWWSNNPSNNVMTRAWLAAGYVSERVDMDSRRLVFRRSGAHGGRGSGAAPATGARPRSEGFLDRIRREMAGTVTIPPGVDVTEPTGETWDAER
jgi:hypothetical protein